jgi:hypothetical protein
LVLNLVSRGFKDNDRYNVLYSTPSCYIKAVNEAAAAQDVEFTVKTDDYFPYASDTHAYWAGYFTSRPNLKRNERLGNNLLQVIHPPHQEEFSFTSRYIAGGQTVGFLFKSQRSRSRPRFKLLETGHGNFATSRRHHWNVKRECCPRLHQTLG